MGQQVENGGQDQEMAAVEPVGGEFELGVGEEVALAARVVVDGGVQAVAEKGEVSLEGTGRDLEGVDKLSTVGVALPFQAVIEPMDSCVAGHG